VVISGRVIDPETGTGVQAALNFVPLPGNAYYGKPGYESYHRPREYRITTGADGRYRLPILPGLGVLMCQARGTVTPDGQLFSPCLLASFEDEDRKRVQEATKGFARYFAAADYGNEILAIVNIVKVLDLAPDAAQKIIDLRLRRGKTAIVSIEEPE